MVCGVCFSHIRALKLSEGVRVLLKNENSSVVEKMRTRKYFLYVPLRLQKLGCRSPLEVGDACFVVFVQEGLPRFSCNTHCFHRT